jgi:hypothetical protein
VIPQLFARLLHYHGTDAKLRAFRHERWIPAKWTNLHQLYARALELGVAKTTVALSSAGPGAMQWSTEQEYIYALLIQQLNMGSLSPAGDRLGERADARVGQESSSSKRCPRTSEGFYVDLASKRGLGAPDGNESGPTLHFLDTTPLADQLERALHAIRRPTSASLALRPRSTCSGSASWKKSVPVVAPNLHGDLRRSPRLPLTVAAKVRVGPRPHLPRAEPPRARRARERRRCQRRADRSVRGSRTTRARAAGITFTTSTTRSPRRSSLSVTRRGR